MHRNRYPQEKLTQMFLLFFLLGFFLSLFLLACSRTYYLQKAGLISDFYLRRLKYRDWEGPRLLGCFLGKRMKWAAFAPLVLLLREAWPVMLLAGGWMGFAFGMILGISVLKFGVGGLGAGFLLVLPQGIFYVSGMLFFFQGLADWEGNHGSWLAFPARKLAGGTLLFFLGILTESFLNPFHLRLLFRFL